MLIEFKCRNFLSFKDEISLNLSTIETYSEHENTHIIKNPRVDVNLLKSIAIYGSNGGGKSNFTKAMSLMDTLVHDSFKESLSKKEDRPSWDFYYKLSPDTIQKPTMFEVSFNLNGIIYRYGFEMYDWKVVSEWLFKTDKRETMLFERTGMDIQYNETGFPEGKRKDEVNPNVLFISLLAQYNGVESSKVFGFFNDLNVVSGLSDINFYHVTKKLLIEDEHFNKWLTVALKFLEISSVRISSDQQNLITKHAIYDNQNILNGFIDFTVEKDESEGTKKLIYLLGAIYDTVKWSRLFVIDEFDSKLHPNLSLKLIRLFHEFNNNGAQFIITAHDPTLLDKEVFRRDQIWFVDRNQFGASELYPMSDFKATDGLRNMSDFRKKYLKSDFGAAESMEFSEPFINLTKEISVELT